jgi:hypothetical protein
MAGDRHRRRSATVGYHLSALYSPVGWLSWERIARAGRRRRARTRRCGRSGTPSSARPGWRPARRRTGSGWRPARGWPAGTVPAGGLFLTAGADVQKDRIEVDVWAWGRGLESWLVDHVVIEGGPGDARLGGS